MIEAVLVVLTKAHLGREADLDDWYTNIHIRDALRFRGSVTAQRFVRAPDQPMAVPADFDWQYFALYDVFDPERFSREHWENALTSRMMVTTAIDDTVLDDYHYYPLAYRNNHPEQRHSGGVVFEQINAAEGRDGDFRDWYAGEYLPAALARPGVQSSALLTFRSFGQMLPTVPRHRYVAIHKVNTSDAWRGWQGLPRLGGSSLVDRSSLLVTHWNPRTGKLTKDDVQHPNAAGLAAEERARARMGDDVITSGADKLGAA